LPTATTRSASNRHAVLLIFAPASAILAVDGRATTVVTPHEQLNESFALEVEYQLVCAAVCAVGGVLGVLLGFIHLPSFSTPQSWRVFVEHPEPRSVKKGANFGQQNGSNAKFLNSRPSIRSRFWSYNSYNCSPNRTIFWPETP
jgi:hypothetical protein